MTSIQLYTTPKLSSFLQALERVRTNPQDDSIWTGAVTEGLQWIVDHLSIDEAPLGHDSGYGHFYCSKGLRLGGLTGIDLQKEVITISSDSMADARSFLLRLICYKAKGAILIWRKAFEDCLQSCTDCVIAHEGCTVDMADRWLRLKLSDRLVSNFIMSLDKALANLCKRSWVSSVELTSTSLPESNSVPPSVCLDTLPPAILLLILSRPGVLSNPEIWAPISNAMARYSTEQPLPILCSDASLPGLTLLAMSSNDSCANNARALLHQIADRNMPLEPVKLKLTSGLQEAAREVIRIIHRGNQSSLPDGSQLLAEPPPNRKSSWQSLLSILRAISPYTGSPSPLFFKLGCLVTSHLSDNGDHITTVLECFGVLLRLMESSYWQNPQVSDDQASGAPTQLLPHQALSQILINNSFIDSLSDSGSTERCLFWLLPLICSAYHMEESLATIFTQLHQIFLCELQKDRELQIRIHAIEISFTPWSNLIFQTLPLQDAQPTEPITSNPATPLLTESAPSISDVHSKIATIIQKRGVLQLYLPILFDLAYHPQYSSAEWDAIRINAQLLIERIAFEDTKMLQAAVQKLSYARSKLEARNPTPIGDDTLSMRVEVTASLWKQLYQSVKMSLPSKASIQVYRLLIRAVSRCAHIDQFKYRSWLPEGRSELLSIKPVTENLKDGCLAICEPFVDALLDLSETTAGSQLVAPVMDDPRVIQALIVLALSPNDGIHASALALVRQWSDCTSRLDCFRVLLSKGRFAAFEGLLISLVTTEFQTKSLPDAMILAGRFVRCMTDVLEVLFSRSEGLFSDPDFMQSINGKQVFQLWNLMCSAVANIFQRTPYWSQFWETSKMTDWMRDALIFAEQLVQQFHAFETACADRDLALGGLSSSKSSDDPIRQQMVDSFMRPTEAILSWLRLTEPDLLDRSASLLVTMLEKLAKFRRPLKDTIVKRLETYLQHNRQPQLQTKKSIGVILTEQQCGNIQKALISHPDLAERFAYVSNDEDEEDEIEVVRKPSPKDSDIRNEGQIANQKAAWGRVLDGQPIKASIPKSVVVPRVPSAIPQKPASKSVAPSIKHDFTSRMNKSTSSKSHTRNAGGSTSGLIGNMRKEFKANRKVLNHTVAKQPLKVSIERGVPSGRSRPSSPTTDYSPVASSSRPVLSSRDTPDEAKQSTGVNLPVAPICLDEEDSESSDEDRPLVTGLAGLANAQKPKIDKPRRIAEPRRTIKLFNDPTLERHQQVVKAKQLKQAQMKLEQLRMSPDFTALHRHILQWDYHHSGPCPPMSPVHYNHLPPSFIDFGQYLRSLEPLLMCECWQQICQAKEAVASGEKTAVPCEVVGRSSVDDFVEIYTMIKHGMLPDRVFFTEADLVLLRAVNKPASHCVMAKVIGLSRKPECFELNLRMHFGSVRSEVSGFLVPKTKWEVIHLCSLSTTHREWAALRSLPYLTLGGDILEARITQPSPITEQQLAKVMHCQKVNEPQGRAIISSLATPGFSLIQGPPGTGKTSTIVGLVGAFIASRPKAQDTRSITRKILLCAPSNAAVDEVAKRLKDGVRGAQGELIIPKLVRIGADSKINMAVKDIFIDELVEAQNKLENKTGEKPSGNSDRIHELRQEITHVREIRNAKQIEAEQVTAASPLYAGLQQEVTKARRKMHELSQQLDEARDQQAASKRYLDAATRKLRMQILQDADVICSTLSGSGHDYMSQLPFDFETVVIDEACQCAEPASLIPLRYNATQCILVGDPLQLPPTVLSQAASKAGYDQSLFVRMQRFAPTAVHLLSIQYRMHPAISAFPSKAFYESRLMDGPDMADRTIQRWHSEDTFFPPYVFYHPIGAREERGRHHSFINRAEASMTVAIYSRLTRTFPDIDFAYRVGIITAYAGQVGEIRRQFRQAFPADVVSTLDINTVDGFQGQEKDIIILSCVRGGKDDDSGGIGFLKDTRRMNVALTRAKSSLFVIGNQSALVQDQNWKALIDDAKERGAFSEVSIDTFNSAPKIRNTSKSHLSSRPIINKSIENKSDKFGHGPLMTPQQISQQSKSHNQSNHQNGLKRKQSINSSLSELSKKTRIIEIDSSDHQKSDIEKPESGTNLLESNQEKHIMNPIRPPQSTVNRNPNPNPGSSSNNKPINPQRAPTMNAKKNPVSLFIKQKKPTRIAAPREGDELDTRTTKERIADEMKTLRKPK